MQARPDAGRGARWKNLGSFIAIWTAVGLVFAAQLRLESLYSGQPLGWAPAVSRGLIGAWLWAALFPLLLALARRFPFLRGSWAISLAVHLPVTLILTLAKLGLERRLAPLVGPLPAAPADPAVFQVALLGCWLLVGVCQSLVHYRRAQDRERRALALEAKLAQAQLQLLRNQLQPHFLFNTLHAISTLMHRDVEAAEAMLTELSDLLRLALESSDKQELTLERELELTRLYLGIQQRRFEDRMHTEFDIDPDTLDALVPNMMLQPIVENAVQHGVSRRTCKGCVAVRARREGPDLRIEVEDDGPTPTTAEPQSWTEGIGLGNTRARLARLYGSDHRLELTRAARGGVRVAVTLPFRTAESEA